MQCSLIYPTKIRTLCRSLKPLERISELNPTSMRSEVMTLPIITFNDSYTDVVLCAVSLLVLILRKTSKIDG